MAKKVINALNGGELSPYLYGRSDVSKYNSGALKCENFIPLVYGGVTRRPAIKHISKLSGAGRIIPFYINRNLKYLLVLISEDQFSEIKVFLIEQDGTESFVETIPTPYILSEFDEIQYVQNNNLLYLTHRNHPLSQIVQTDDGFKFSQTNFTFPPFLPPTLGSTLLYFFKASGISNSYLQSNQPYFTTSDIGSHIKINALRTKDTAEINLSTAIINQTATNGYSNSINVSYSNYTIEVEALGRFDLYVQKSVNQEPFRDDFKLLSNKTGTSILTTTYLSPAQEKGNVRIRLRYDGAGKTSGSPTNVDSFGQIKARIIPANNVVEGIVKIISLEDSKKAYVEIVNEPLYDASTVSEWVSSGTYAVGDYRKTASAIPVTQTLSSSDMALATISGSAPVDHDRSFFLNRTDSTIAEDKAGSSGKVIFQVRNDLSNGQPKLYKYVTNYSGTKTLTTYTNSNYTYKDGKSFNVPNNVTISGIVYVSNNTFIAQGSSKPRNQVYDGALPQEVNYSSYNTRHNAAQVGLVISQGCIFFKIVETSANTFEWEKLTLFRTELSSFYGESPYGRDKDHKDNYFMFSHGLAYFDGYIYSSRSYLTRGASSDTEMGGGRRKQTSLNNYYAKNVVDKCPLETIMNASYKAGSQISDQDFSNPIYEAYSGHVPNSGTPYPSASRFYKNPINNLFYSFELYRLGTEVFIIGAGMDTSIFQNDKPYGIRIFSVPKDSSDYEADIGGAPNNYIGFRGTKIYGANYTSTTGKNKVLVNGVPTVVTPTAANLRVKTLDEAYTKQPILVKESSNNTSAKIHYNTDGDDLSEIIISNAESGLQNYYECVEAYTNNGSNTFKQDIDAGKWVTAPHQTNDFSESAFSFRNGFAKCAAFFDDRLILGGSINNGNKLYASQLDDFTYFKEGVLDTDAFQTTLVSNEMEEIEWFCVKNQLTIGTNNSEWSLDNPNGNITPSAFSLKRRSKYGSNSNNAILLGDSLAFLMRDSKKLREWQLRDDQLTVKSSDLTILSEHISKSGINTLNLQGVPDNIIWATKNNGDLAGLTYSKEQDVYAWHTHNLNNSTVSVIDFSKAVNQTTTAAAGAGFLGYTKVSRMDERWAFEVVFEITGKGSNTEPNVIVDTRSYYVGTSNPSIAIQSAALNLNTVRIDTANAHGFDGGDIVTIANLGFTTTNPNGDHEIVKIDDTAFVYTLSGANETYTTGSTPTATFKQDTPFYVTHDGVDTLTVKVGSAEEVTTTCTINEPHTLYLDINYNNVGLSNFLLDQNNFHSEEITNTSNINKNITFFNIYKGFDDNNFALTYPSAQGYFYSARIWQSAYINTSGNNYFSIENVQYDDSSNVLTVTTTKPHGLSATDPVKIRGIQYDTSTTNPNTDYNVTSVTSTTIFTVTITGSDPDIESITPETVEILAKNATASSSTITNSADFAYETQAAQLYRTSNGQSWSTTASDTANLISTRKDVNKFLSITAIPSKNDDDSLYCIAKILNGNGVFDYYFGKFNKREWGEDYTTEYQGSDFYRTLTHTGATALSISGFDDFANMTVSVTKNGVDQGNKLVSDTGVITINAVSGDKFVVGLPYTSTVAPMYITDQNNINKIKGSQKALLHFKDTLSAKAGQTESSVEDVRFDGDDTGLKSGMAEVYFNNASDYLNTCFVVQEKAEPCTLLSMVAYIE